VGLHSKALFWGVHLTPGPTGPTPPNGGISFENWAGANKQKLLLAVGLQSKILFLRVHLTPGPTKGVFALPSSAVLKPAQAGLVTSFSHSQEHNDRLVFGSTHIWIFQNPKEPGNCFRPIVRVNKKNKINISSENKSYYDLVILNQLKTEIY
jgi:hypothetical protein